MGMTSRLYLTTVPLSSICSPTILGKIRIQVFTLPMEAFHHPEALYLWKPLEGGQRLIGTWKEWWTLERHSSEYRTSRPKLLIVALSRASPLVVYELINQLYVN